MREHCWHSEGLEFTSYPSFHYDKCCHCGKRRRNGGKFAVLPGHGPHVALTREIVPDIEDVGPCKEESA